MFAEMRAVLGITKQTDILDHIYALPTPEAREEGMEAIRAIERAAMKDQKAQPGLQQLMSYLSSRSVPKAICTRNFDHPVAHLLEKFLPGHVFAPVVTRDFRPPKPHPAGILHIARAWGLVGGAGQEGGEAVEGLMGEPDASGLIMVGDSIDDMTAGRRAGAATVLLVNDANRHLVEHENTDLTINRLDELIGILEEGFKGRAM
jgi:phosphoglycolate phosphatase-like HAD superfamily hydrolase